jgi:hypothetical protein
MAAMIHLVLNSKNGKPVLADGSSAAQLRREADKARKLADAAFGEQERQQLIDVAASLEREAAQIEATIALYPVTRL